MRGPRNLYQETGFPPHCPPAWKISSVWPRPLPLILEEKRGSYCCTGSAPHQWNSRSFGLLLGQEGCQAQVFRRQDWAVDNTFAKWCCRFSSVAWLTGMFFVLNWIHVDGCLVQLTVKNNRFRKLIGPTHCLAADVPYQTPGDTCFPFRPSLSYLCSHTSRLWQCLI